jgi:hypothetical protein
MSGAWAFMFDDLRFMSWGLREVRVYGCGVVWEGNDCGG